MAAGTALIALEPPAIDKPMLLTLATLTLVPVGASGLSPEQLLLRRSPRATHCSSVPYNPWNSGRERPFWNWMALHDIARLVYSYQPRRPVRPARSELGNQVVPPPRPTEITEIWADL